MKNILLVLLALAFLSCSDESEVKTSQEPQEEVLIEQNDEKTEVNDSNVPLPVGESSTQLQNQITALTLFHKGGGVKKNDSIL